MRAPEKSIGNQSKLTLESRYEIERTLGQGAMGVVYEVLDRETGERLALKKLLRIDQRAVTRLKQEFRALANIHHRNLVKLYDLGFASDAWFITMEHLDGCDLLSFLRGRGGQELGRSTATRTIANDNSTREGLAHVGQTTALRTLANDDRAGADSAQVALDKLCGTFLQLARAIGTLHQAAMLHRDLKPSNVMVERDRVVVLDFGLVRGVGDDAATVTLEDALAGTPAYMAPEQVQGSVLSEATDWYAFGVMLYEAVSGALPIEGTLAQLLKAKLERDPLPLAQLRPDLPADLCELCMGLLQRAPRARPGYDQISAVLMRHTSEPEETVRSELAEPLRATVTRTQAPVPLLGRKPELDHLERAFRHMQHDKCAVVHVRAPSGSGKSTLVEQFVAGLEMRTGSQDRVVLRARCYEHEAMPFKALDGLVDALVGQLSRWDEMLVSYVLPRHLAELTHAFPVFERLPSAMRLLRAGPPDGDAVRERTRAELALGDLLRRLASRKEVVLWIDDLQWGDLDSVAILKGWLELPNPPSLLLIFSYRSEDYESSACLKWLSTREPTQAVLESFIDMAPLAAADVETLCAHAFGESAQQHQSLIERIVGESQGSPFLARQLVALAKAQLAQGETALDGLSVHQLVAQLTALLPDSARSLLEVVAVAGRPLTLALALGAAQLGKDGRSQLHALKSLNLTRTRLLHGQPLIEVYHDRVRESVLRGLSDSTRVAIHRNLLDALEPQEQTNPDWLYLLALGAHDAAATKRYGRIAAARASASLAFERAAELYRQCLTHSDETSERALLWRLLADALAASGHGSRAAEAYVEAAKHGPPKTRAELTRSAAMHFISSGDFERGESLVREVLEDLDLSVPSSEAGVIAAIGWERLRLSVRSLSFEERSEAATAPTTRLRAETYGILSVDTQSYAPVRAALFQARALRMSLELGEPKLVITALCITATMRVVSGSSRDEQYAQSLLERAAALAQRSEEPLLRARVQGARSICACLTGRIPECVALWEQADALYREGIHSGGALPSEQQLRFTLNTARIAAMYTLGQFVAGHNELHKALREAAARDNRAVTLMLSMTRAIDDVVQGQPARARARLDEERSQLPSQGFGPLHMLHLTAVLRIGCALADPAWAWAAAGELWQRFQRSMVRHSVLSIIVYDAHARLALNEHVLQQRKGSARALMRDDLSAIYRASPRQSTLCLSRLHARIAYLEGQVEQAVAYYRKNVAIGDEFAYADETERGRWALGRLLGGDEGKELCTRALSTLRAQGVQNPLADLAGSFPELF